MSGPTAFGAGLPMNGASKLSPPPVGIPVGAWEEAVALLSHRDAKPYNLEITARGGLFGARIYPPQTQHLRGNFSALSGSFYGVGSSPREAVMEAVARWNEFQAGYARACAVN